MKRSFYKKLLNLAIYFCIFWKALCPFLGFAYLLTWILMILDISAFSQLDFFLGPLPRFIDSLFPHQTDIFGSEFPMGYIYCAALVIITMYFALKLQIKLLEKKARIENCEKKEKERSEKLIKRKKDKLPKINTGFVTNFYGLFEIDLKYTNSNNKNKENLEKLKNEYLKMLVSNLSKKYPNVEFNLSNKVFFVSKDFLIFDPFLLDIMKLYKIFVELDNEKCIKTDLYLSFMAGNDNNSNQYMQNLLNKINNLGYVNKVIIIDKFIEKYKSLKGKQFKLHSLGMSKVETDDFKELDVELNYLKRD